MLSHLENDNYELFSLCVAAHQMLGDDDIRLKEVKRRDFSVERDFNENDTVLLTVFKKRLHVDAVLLCVYCVF